jgi:branched-subunit amino acid transport protein
MNPWIVLIVSGVITFVIRLSFIALWGKFSVPIWLQRALRFVPPAVLSAIIFPEVFIQDGTVSLDVGNGRLLGGVVAVIVAWKTKNAIYTILLGILALLASRYLFNL